MCLRPFVSCVFHKAVLFSKISQKNPKPKRNIQDSVFRRLFSSKENILDLYRTLHPEDSKTTVDDIDLLTLHHVPVNSMYNDLSFSVRDDRIILVEAQSTQSPMITIRLFLYIADTLKDYLRKHHLIRMLYANKLTRLPAIEAYVVYTGKGKIETKFLLLSKILKKGSFLDLTVKTIPFEEGRKEVIFHYMKFCMIFLETRDNYVKEAGKRCRELTDEEAAKSG